MDQELLRRLRLDFTKRETDLLSYIQTYFPDVSPNQLKTWQQTGALESMELEGETYYFNRAAENLFRIDAVARARKEAVDGAVIPPREQTLKIHIPEVISELKTSERRYGTAQAFTMTFSITVNADATPAGELIRCWLPYPRTDEKRQTNIRLLSTSEPHYDIAPDTCAHKTIYQEKRCKGGVPTEFSVSYTFQINPEWQAVTSENVQPYDKESATYQQFCAERAPHIIFSDAIKALSKTILGNEKHPYEQAKKLFVWLRANYPWASAREYSTIDHISDYVIANKHGDCGQLSLLFITLCRYNGIPARWQSGFMLHPNGKNLHDWAEIYFEGVGWIPVDSSFGLQAWGKNDDEHLFFFGGQDAYHLTINNDFGRPLSPEKMHLRSETVDFQRGEVEWRGGNLYFDQWDYAFTVAPSPPSTH
jgi:transglutaminase-like putative cysteine protease